MTARRTCESMGVVTEPAPTPQQVRRALARAERGAALDVAEAAALLAATGEDLDRLTAVAARVRDAGLVAAGRPGVVTYSPKVFIPVTRLCRDRCHYCTFVESPGAGGARGAGAVPLAGRDPGHRPRGRRAGLPGGAVHPRRPPEDRWPEAQAWLDEQGYDSTLAYVRAMAVRVLEETGLLPHLNPGVMSWEEMNAPQAGLPVDGDDARDHLAAALRDQGAGALRVARQGPRRSGCGCSRTPAGCRSRSPPACWSASARR